MFRTFWGALCVFGIASSVLACSPGSDDGTAMDPTNPALDATSSDSVSDASAQDFGPAPTDEGPAMLDEGPLPDGGADTGSEEVADDVPPGDTVDKDAAPGVYACCLPDGACVDVLPVPCEALGGAHHAGHACASRPLRGARWRSSRGPRLRRQRLRTGSTGPWPVLSAGR